MDKVTTIEKDKKRGQYSWTSKVPKRLEVAGLRSQLQAQRLARSTLLSIPCSKNKRGTFFQAPPLVRFFFHLKFYLMKFYNTKFPCYKQCIQGYKCGHDCAFLKNVIADYRLSEQKFIISLRLNTLIVLKSLSNYSFGSITVNDVHVSSKYPP